MTLKLHNGQEPVASADTDMQSPYTIRVNCLSMAAFNQNWHHNHWIPCQLLIFYNRRLSNNNLHLTRKKITCIWKILSSQIWLREFKVREKSFDKLVTHNEICQVTQEFDVINLIEAS